MDAPEITLKTRGRVQCLELVVKYYVYLCNLCFPIISELALLTINIKQTLRLFFMPIHLWVNASKLGSRFDVRDPEEDIGW